MGLLNKFLLKFIQIQVILLVTGSIIFAQSKIPHHTPAHSQKKSLHHLVPRSSLASGDHITRTLKTGNKEVNFNGQWRGEFVDNSTAFVGFGGEKIDYVLELETNGNTLKGYSYTYFSNGMKRYYTICKVKGSFDRQTKEVTVTEFERTKFNTPPDFRNCFQVHKLRYNKDNPEEESITGTWFPAPNQEGDCGYGKTSLSRKIVLPLVHSNERKKVNTDPVKKEQFKDLNRDQKPVVINKPKPAIKDPVKKSVPAPERKPAKTDQQTAKTLPKVQPQVKDTFKKKDVVVEVPKKEAAPLKKEKFESRNNTLLQTINIKNETFTVDFYDDGIVDGDTITVIYNGAVVLSKKMLTEKPITLTLKVDPNKAINELVMYAESLGEIPPNTALMIVHDGDNRYEARIVSDTERNGTIRFTHIPK